jgi:hypothetical protein
LGEEEYKGLGYKYIVSLSAVSPEAAGEENVKKALRDFDVSFEEACDEMKVEALHQYGISSPLKDYYGFNAFKLMKEARKEFQVITMLFGFYMDGYKNRMGHTGWDWIKGDLSLETAQKNRKEYFKTHPQEVAA